MLRTNDLDMHEVICPQLDLIVVDRTRTSIVVVEIYRKITQTEKLTSWLGTWRCFISANKFIRSAIYGIWIDARHLGIANRSRPVRLLFSFWKNHNTYVLCRNDEETPEGCDANKSSEEPGSSNTTIWQSCMSKIEKNFSPISNNMCSETSRKYKIFIKK